MPDGVSPPSHGAAVGSNQTVTAGIFSDPRVTGETRTVHREGPPHAHCGGAEVDEPEHLAG